MRLHLGELDLVLYVNDRKHDFYGYRAVVDLNYGGEEYRGVWEDSWHSRAEALGKLLIRLSGLAPKTRRGKW